MFVERHLQFAKYLMLSLAIWPLKLSFFPQLLYESYYRISYLYFSLFEVSQIIRLISLIRMHAWEEVFVNLGVVCSYVLSLFKVYYIRAPKIQQLFSRIQLREKEIAEENNEEVIKIYNRHASLAKISAMTHVGVGTACISMYFTNPIMVNRVLKEEYLLANDTNETLLNRVLIFSSYLPFDSQKHYWIAYWIQLSNGVYGYSYTVYSTAVFFTLFIYCTGQLRIFQHYLRNMYEYAQQYADEHQELTREEAEFRYSEKLILFHREIIDFVNSMDETLQNFMLFEFLVASLKISLLILQILKTLTIDFGTITVASYVLVTLLELYFVYWNANEIIIESTEGVTEAIFYGNWYLLNNNVKKNLVPMMLKAKKPCKMSIGPFYIMSLQSALSILKACYYYVCLIRQREE